MITPVIIPQSSAGNVGDSIPLRYLSIVAHNELPDCFLVRSRESTSLDHWLPDQEIKSLSNADYPYRCLVTGAELAELMLVLAKSINYANFKNAVKEPERHSAYFDVYHASLALDSRN